MITTFASLLLACLRPYALTVNLPPSSGNCAPFLEHSLHVRDTLACHALCCRGSLLRLGRVLRGACFTLRIRTSFVLLFGCFALLVVFVLPLLVCSSYVSLPTQPTRPAYSAADVVKRRPLQKNSFASLTTWLEWCWCQRRHPSEPVISFRDAGMTYLPLCWKVGTFSFYKESVCKKVGPPDHLS